MRLSDILKKAAAGEELSAEEKDFLSKYQEPVDNSSEITSLKNQLAALTTERDNLKAKADEEENKNLSEAEKLGKQITALQEQVNSLTAERDTLKQSAAESAFRHGIEELARKHKCVDVDYLLFKAQRAELDLTKEGKVTEFMEGFKKDSPKFFEADVNQGGGGTPPQNNTEDTDSATRIEELLKKDSLTEKEVAEVIKLQDENSKEQPNT